MGQTEPSPFPLWGRLALLLILWAILAGLGMVGLPNLGRLLGVLPGPARWLLGAVMAYIGLSMAAAAFHLSFDLITGRYNPGDEG